MSQISTFKRIGTVVGIGPRKKGISAAGNPYDFSEIAVTIPRKGWDGEYPLTARITGENLDKYCLTPGSIVDCLLTIQDFHYVLLAIIGVA